jgi:hypothetical protein
LKATKDPQVTHKPSVETVKPDSSHAGRLSISVLLGSQGCALATGAGDQPPGAGDARRHVDGGVVAVGRGAVSVVVADARLIGG